MLSFYICTIIKPFKINNMKTEEFVLNELKESFINEAKNCFRGEELISTELKIAKLISKEALKDIDLIKVISKDKALAKLKYSISTLLTINDIFTVFDDYYLEVFPIKKLLDQIRKKMTHNPKNRIFPYLWVKLSVRYFKVDEYFESEVVAFYKELFENYDYLIALDNMSLDTDYLKFPSANLYNNKELTKVFENAVQKFQNNSSFLEGLIYSYAYQEYFDKALTTIDVYLNNLPDKHKKFDYEENEFREYYSHLSILQTLTVINYDLGLIEDALESANLLLDNLAKTEVVGVKEDIRGLETSLFIRVSINLKIGKKEALEYDYNLIRRVHTCLDYPDLEGEKFKDAIEYLDYKGMLDDLG